MRYRGMSIIIIGWGHQHEQRSSSNTVRTDWNTTIHELTDLSADKVAILLKTTDWTSL